MPEPEPEREREPDPQAKPEPEPEPSEQPEPKPEPAPDLRTARLRLRQFARDDAADVVALCDNLAVSRMLAFVPHPYSRDDALFFIDEICSKPESVNWAVTEASSGALLGTVSVEGIGEDSSLGRTGTLGFWYGEPHWGRGYATEAAEAALRHVFETLPRPLDAVRSAWFVDNVGSARVHEKLGFVAGGDVRDDPCVARGGPAPAEHVLLRREEWLSRGTACEEAAELEPEPEVENAEQPAAADEHGRKMAVLIAGFVCWMFGSQLTTPARSEMLLQIFHGDTVAAAGLVGRLSSVSSVIGLFGNPLVGSLSDRLGRKPVLMMGALVSIARHSVWLVRPGITAMVIADLLAPLSQVAMMVPGRSGIGDMYSKNDPLTLSVALSRWSMVPAVCMIVCPTLGGRLAAINPRLPFVRRTIVAGIWVAFFQECQQ